MDSASDPPRRPMERISFCMIVRDEEAFLPQCLASVQGLVDEIVIVDTGSTDSTVRIAEEAGAKVLHYEWNDHFADARNVGLDAATGTHVLTLDADEVLAPGAHEVLREAARNPELSVALLPLINAPDLTMPAADVVSRKLANPIYVPRFFKRHPALRFRGRVHELIFNDFEVLRREVGGVVQPLEASIVHYGGVEEVRLSRDKFERNVSLMERALDEDPDNHYLAGQLCTEYYAAKMKDEAEALCWHHFPKVIDEIDRITAEEPHRTDRPWPIRLAGTLALILVEKDKFEEALQIVANVTERIPRPHPNLAYVQGFCLERLGYLDDAVERYRVCIELAGAAFNEPVFSGVCGERAWTRLGSVLLAMGRPSDAYDEFAKIQVTDGRYYLARTLGTAEALLDLGQPDRALGDLMPMTRAKVPIPDLFALLSRALRQAGADDTKVRQTARSFPMDRWLEPRRRPLVYEEAELVGASAGTTSFDPRVDDA